MLMCRTWPALSMLEDTSSMDGSVFAVQLEL
jgi:hypothetical protein